MYRSSFSSSSLIFMCHDHYKYYKLKGIYIDRQKGKGCVGVQIECGNSRHRHCEIAWRLRSKFHPDSIIPRNTIFCGDCIKGVKNMNEPWTSEETTLK